LLKIEIFLVFFLRPREFSEDYFFPGGMAQSSTAHQYSEQNTKKLPVKIFPSKKEPRGAEGTKTKIEDIPESFPREIAASQQ